jgi:hypothetical protein
MRGRLGRRRHGSQSTGMAAGVKPRSREAVRLFPQGFTRDDNPGEDEWWRRVFLMIVVRRAPLSERVCGMRRIGHPREHSRQRRRKSLDEVYRAGGRPSALWC